MTVEGPKTPRADWRAIHRELSRRISTREWAPGDLIPGEETLAAEFGCARATVNRALNALAEAGLVVRRRKAGTRVAETPIRQAKLSIPLIREEIEALGADYAYRLISSSPADMAPPGRFAPDAPLVHVAALHFADSRPYVLETRWIDCSVVPGADRPDLFASQSANEWLVRHAPYAGGEMVMSAAPANATEAEALGVSIATPLFIAERLTRAPSANGGNAGSPVTFARLAYAPGRKLRLHL